MKLAVILAGGLGSRLQKNSKNKPKGFIEVNDTTLISRSISILKRNGIEKIIIGTGFKQEYYQELARKEPGISCVNNPHYASTGSLYTFYNMRNHINEDFILLESDLLYEEKAIRALIETNLDDCILVSEKTNSNDEVYIEAPRNYLKKMSKNSLELGSIDGELVGISKVSLSLYEHLKNYCKTILDDKPELHYEDWFNAVSDEVRVSTLLLRDFYWCEIDTLEHLQRAENLILPKINLRERNA